jgi:hypothetical protein
VGKDIIIEKLLKLSISSSLLNSILTKALIAVTKIVGLSDTFLSRINEYKKYQGKVESIYNNLELAGESFKKDKLLQLIRHKYLTVQGKFLRGSKIYDPTW